MRIGILSVRDEMYHPNRRIMETASKLGHEAFLIHTRDCLPEISAKGAYLRLPLVLAVRAASRRDNRGGTPLPQERPEADTGEKPPDVLIPRIGATINDYALCVVRQFELSGVRVVNGFESILLARNKFLGLQMLKRHGITVPKSCLVVTPEGFERAVKELGGYPVVAKMPASRQGEGVVLIRSGATAAFLMHNLQDSSNGILVQEYLSDAGRTDIRAFVVGDRLAGAMKVRPGPGDFRSNIHLTGMGKPAALNETLSDIAIESARTLGLEIAGVDVIVPGDAPPKVIEVNYSPGFRGLEAATGADMALEILQYITETQPRR